MSRPALTLSACALLLWGGAASAQPLEGRALRLSLGVVRPEALGSAAWFGAGFRMRAGRFGIEPEVGFWSRQETAFGLSANARDLHAGMNADWSLLRRGRARLYSAGGGSAHRVTSVAGPLGGAAASETHWRAGLQGTVGLELRVGGRSAALAGFRWDWIPRRALPDERETRVFAGLRLAL